MEKLSNVLPIAFCLGLALLVACQNDDPVAPTPQEEALAKLTGNWSLPGNGGVMIDGEDASLNFSGFSIMFSNRNYSTTNSGDLFPAAGTWDWVNDSAMQINLDDGKELIILELTTQLLKFSFTYTGEGGVANGLAGNYVITVGK